MHQAATAESATPRLSGGFNLVAALYDLVVGWFVMGRREHAFREGMLDVAEVRPGDSVLVGCGTGTLAVHAKRRVGDLGRVAGVDPSQSLLAGARRKVAKEKRSIDLRQGGVEQLDFPDDSFDMITSSFVMHHISD